MDFDRVDVTGLVKVYGATRALVGVDASFMAGAVTVVEGPNEISHVDEDGAAVAIETTFHEPRPGTFTGRGC